MESKLTITYGIMNFLFIGSGALMIAMALSWFAQMAKAPTVGTVASILLLTDVPCTPLIVNGVIVIITGLMMLPALAIRSTISVLKIQAWLVVGCSFFTMAIGLAIWFKTLMTRNGFQELWNSHSPTFKDLLQQKFQCCGYMDSTSFQADALCPNALKASTVQACVGPFSVFGQHYLNVIFTSAFGLVALDVALLLCVVSLQKVRSEERRYRLIDRKRGVNNI